MKKKLYKDYFFKQKDLPLWIILLNYVSLIGVPLYPIVGIVTYARSVDDNPYHPTPAAFFLFTGTRGSWY
jgi:hypothetical protein